MGKNKEMIKCFIKVLNNDPKETNNVIPNMYQKDIYNIDYQYLLDKNIDSIIFDIDNTIVPTDDIEIPNELTHLFQKLNQNFKICIMSNGSEKRVIPVAKSLNVKYIFKSQKPKKEAYQKALKELNSLPENTAMIGDQMMSDIKGARQVNMYAILVDPLSEKHNIQTKTSRVLQDVLEKHLEKRHKFISKKYYKEELK